MAMTIGMTPEEVARVDSEVERRLAGARFVPCNCGFDPQRHHCHAPDCARELGEEQLYDRLFEEVRDEFEL